MSHHQRCALTYFSYRDLYDEKMDFIQSEMPMLKMCSTLDLTRVRVKSYLLSHCWRWECKFFQTENCWPCLGLAARIGSKRRGFIFTFAKLVPGCRQKKKNDIVFIVMWKEEVDINSTSTATYFPSNLCHYAVLADPLWRDPIQIPFEIGFYSIFPLKSLYSFMMLTCPLLILLLIIWQYSRVRCLAQALLSFHSQSAPHCCTPLRRQFSFTITTRQFSFS